MPFFQAPPELGNQYVDDDMLRRYVRHALPPDVFTHVEPELLAAGELSGGELYRQLLSEERHDEPRLISWDAWGHRIDRVEVSALWKKAAAIAAEKGLIATAYEKKNAEFSRIHQFALLYVLEASLGVYSCPLAMSDGAAKTLLVSKNDVLAARALPRLLSRDPALVWTSGQWMTERTGGSDVAISETIAKPDGDAFLLYGTKWFTSAAASEMTVTLARPEGNPPGGAGLALFYLETRKPDGTMNGIQVNRLKDKLGTRMVPTAELLLDGARAFPILGTRDGVRNITPMLHITRTWNSVCAVSGMRRALALAKDYARRRVVFGAKLADKPLHADTLAGMEAEYEGAFLLAFRAAELLGKDEAGVMNEHEAALLRLMLPITKLLTAKQAVAIASETLEAFGGAGYIEDTGLPRLLRDAQVLPIWEGTTNVLSLDVLRVLAKGGTLAPIAAEVRAAVENAPADLGGVAAEVVRAVTHAEAWFEKAKHGGPDVTEAGARRLAMTLGRALEVAFLVRLARLASKENDHVKPAAAARRMTMHGIDLIVDDVVSADRETLAR